MAYRTHPFGDYVPITGTVDATAKSQIQTNIDELKRFIPDGTEGSSPVDKPGFDAQRNDVTEKLLKELDEFNALIQAA